MPSGHPLKKSESFPLYTPPQTPLLWRAAFPHPYHNFPVFLIASCLGCYFLERRAWGLSQKSSVSLPLNCESAIIDATVEGSLSFVVSRSTDHGLPHGIWPQCRPQTSTWPPALACAIDLDMVSCGNTGHRHQCGPWLQPSPRMSSWLQVAAQTMDMAWILIVTWATDINRDPDCSQMKDPDMVPSVSMDHRRQQVLSQGDSTYTSTWPPRGSSGLGCCWRGSASLHHICLATPTLYCKSIQHSSIENCIVLLGTFFGHTAPHANSGCHKSLV